MLCKTSLPFLPEEIHGQLQELFPCSSFAYIYVLEYSQMLIGLYNRAESRKKYFVHF